MHLHCSVSPGKHVSAPEVSSVGGTGVCLALPFHVASEELHASGPEAHTQQFCEPPGVQARGSTGTGSAHLALAPSLPVALSVAQRFPLFT